MSGGNRVVTYRNAVECSAPRGLVNSDLSISRGAIIARALRTPYEHLAGYMERYWLVKPSPLDVRHRRARASHPAQRPTTATCTRIRGGTSA
jgi:hypothetical protein